MKGGLAAIMETARVLRDRNVELPGDLLLTTHGLHEAPTGHGEGLLALIGKGLHGDAAVVAEGPSEELAVAGRGMAIFTVVITTSGKSGHENDTPHDTPHPLVAAGEVVRALEAERVRLRLVSRQYVGTETIFVGQVHGGDFYNRFPTSAFVQGTRRYFADHASADVKAELEQILARVATETGTRIALEFDRIRDGFEISLDAAISRAFRWSYRALESKDPPIGAFKSVADVSLLVQNAGIPAVFCGNRGTGPHADLEVMPVDELVRQTRMLLGIIVAYFGLHK
jgi:acetylornithine deacetylase